MKKELTEDEKFERVQNSTWAIYMEKLFNIILLNLNFVLYTCLGLIIFGLGPSLIAAYQVLDEYKGAGFDSELFKKYFKYWRKSFIIGNGLVLSLGLCLFIIVNSINFYTFKTGLFSQVGLYVMVICFLLLIGFATMSFPIFAIYDQKQIIEKIRITIYIQLINPLKMLLVFISLFGLVVIFALFPQFVLIFGFGISIATVYKYSMNMIGTMKNKIENKKEQTS